MEAAGIVALVRATTSTALQARKLSIIWKDAPRDVFNLRDELDTCKAFLKSIQTGILESSLINNLEKHHGSEAEPGEELHVLIRRAELVVKSLGDILTELLGEQTDPHVVVDEKTAKKVNGEPQRLRYAFRKKILWLRRLESVCKLRKMLRRTTDDLALCLTILNVKITAAHATRGLAGTACVLQEFEANIIARLTDIVWSPKDNLEKTLEESAISVQDCISLDRRLGESIWFENNTPVGAKGFEGLISGTKPSTKPITGDLFQTPRMMASDGLDRSGWGWDAGPPSLPPGPRNPIPNTTATRAGSRRQCMCHYNTDTVSTGLFEVSWLQHVLGSLKILYRSFKHTKIQAQDMIQERQLPRCTDCICIDSKAYCMLLVQYSFPQWLTRAIISMYFTHNDRPELLIRVNRVVSSTDPSFKQSVIGNIWLNDIHAVKRILANCPSSVMDIHRDGRSALLYAVTHRRTDIAQLLLQAGADPFHRSQNDLCPAIQALRFWLSGDTTDETGGVKMAGIMPFSQAMEEDNFTDLHRVVIGFLPIDLATALTIPTIRAQVNNKTSSGWTPLHLAAQFHKTTKTAIQLLVAAGADTNVKTPNGHSPLSHACLSGNNAAVEALLEAETWPPIASTTDRPHQNVLHSLVSVHRLCSPGLLDEILKPDNGMDINGKNFWGISPIMTAIGYNNYKALGWLIERGAEIDPVDPDGDTPLYDAVFYNTHQSARTLLGLSVGQPEIATLVTKGLKERYRYVNPQRGHGICHYLAEVGDKETMEIFTELRMTGMPDVGTFKDPHGRTALDLFQARTGVYVAPGCHVPGPLEEEEDEEQRAKRELIEAWVNLLGSINQEPVEDSPDKTGNKNHARAFDTGDDRSCGDGDRDMMGYESDSDLEFFDAREN